MLNNPAILFIPIFTLYSYTGISTYVCGRKVLTLSLSRIKITIGVMFDLLIALVICLLSWSLSDLYVFLIKFGCYFTSIFFAKILHNLSCGECGGAMVKQTGMDPERPDDIIEMQNNHIPSLGLVSFRHAATQTLMLSMKIELNDASVQTSYGRDRYDIANDTSIAKLINYKQDSRLKDPPNTIMTLDQECQTDICNFPEIEEKEVNDAATQTKKSKLRKVMDPSLFLADTFIAVIDES